MSTHMNEGRLYEYQKRLVDLNVIAKMSTQCEDFKYNVKIITARTYQSKAEKKSSNKGTNI